MGIKKIARPMNKAKNAFVKWLKENDVDCLDIFEGKKEPDDGWTYYRSVTGFVRNNLYTVTFMVWEDIERIEYSDEENRYDNLEITEFMDLIR